MKGDLKFASSDGRDYFAVLLRNHWEEGPFKPKLAVVGLSPAANQIQRFVETYRLTGSYQEASIKGAFAGLAPKIFDMFDGLGLTERLGLDLPHRDSFENQPAIYATSLVACASLSGGGSSEDFDPLRFPAATRCILQRFMPEMTNPGFDQMKHIVILGGKAWTAVQKSRTTSGQTLIEALRLAGKNVFTLPHPSGSNGEYVALATFPTQLFPQEDEYVERMWAEYERKPPKQGKPKEGAATYKAKRRRAWSSIHDLRERISQLVGDR